MAGSLPKQFQEVHNTPILAHTIRKFEACDQIDDLIVVTARDWMSFVAAEVVDRFGFTKVRRIIEGGAERQDSVYRGLDALDDEVEIVLVHDAARPFVSISKLTEIVQAAREFGAAVLAVPPRDTIKFAGNGFVSSTLDRGTLWCVQTPQAFAADLLKQAYKEAYERGVYSTDDSALVELIGKPVRIVSGEETNIKLTVPADWKLAELLLHTEE